MVCNYKGNIPQVFSAIKCAKQQQDVLQVKEHGENIEDQLNDPMEEDDNNNIVEDDGTNILIQGIFARMDQGNLDDIHDVPLCKKA